MKSGHLNPWSVIALLISFPAHSQPVDQKITLRDNWTIQSSKEIHNNGSAISLTSFKPEKWYPASVPSTVFGTLVEDKVYPDPYYGTNIESIPGYSTDRNRMPAESPFAVPWWYRTTFTL